MQQSKKLQEENAKESSAPAVPESDAPAKVSPAKGGGKLKIRPIAMFNDWVAILQDHDEIATNAEGRKVIEVKEEVLAKPEGIVVGRNERGVPDGAGGMIPSHVQIGDRVAFPPKNALQAFKPAETSDSPYKGRTIVIISERNLIYKLHGKVDFELID